MSKHLHNALLVKAAVTLGLIVYMLVPSEYEKFAALSTNLLWLWRT